MILNCIDELFTVISNFKKQTTDTCSPIPLFSFEGLPGAGKTTQIKKVAESLDGKFGKPFYVDLPTSENVGPILRALYKSEIKWDEQRKKNPWLNPLLLSVDLRLAIKQAMENDAKYALMSRGILSTYYYNLDAFPGRDTDACWEQMERYMGSFYKPNVIIYLDVPENIAYERVVRRNRGPLRLMDQVEQMKKDKNLLHSYLARLNSIPVYEIDATASVEKVTENIVSVLERFLQ